MYVCLYLNAAKPTFEALVRLRCYRYMQLEEYKDAFRIFDRSGTGSFTAEDIDWVMRSLGQNPTQPQIDAIIRDMDLDNDGVIDLAEFMIRMMALTTKVDRSTATCVRQSQRLYVLVCLLQSNIHYDLNGKLPCTSGKLAFTHDFPISGPSEQACLQTAAEEDLKHVFDVLDKSGEGMLNADSLRTAIKVHSMGA